MDRRALLQPEGHQDDQLLETDVMRFVAIVGIVFWIVFAMIKSIPFQEKQTPSVLEKPVPAPSVKKETPVVSESNGSLPIESIPVHTPRPIEIHEPPPIDKHETEKPAPAAAEPLGIQLQFQSRADLLRLLEAGKVRVFCRARARGFDLLFQGKSVAGAVEFTGSDAMPEAVWEIKSGSDRTYFLDQTARKFPAMRSFPQQEVFVSFEDKKLEDSVVAMLEDLQARSENGVISVTAQGTVVFRATAQGGDK